MTIQEVRERLKTVKDPELGVSIVDLGLIYDIKLDLPTIKIVMTLTSPGCPLGGAIIMMMRDALAHIPGVNPEKDVVVEIVFDPPWVADMMSEEAKCELGF